MKLLFYSVFAVVLINLIGFAIHFITQISLKKALFSYRLSAPFHGVMPRVWMTGAGLVFLVLSLGASKFFFGRAVPGLLSLVFFPYLMQWMGAWILSERKRSLDASSIAFLYALQGLVKVGVSMPQALFKITQSQEGLFAESFSKYLDRYEEGTSLSELILRFRSRSLLGFSGSFLASLEMAHRKGLSVAILLEHMIPLLEAECQSFERIRSLRRSIWVQVFVTFLLPWCVLLALFSFQPEMWSHVSVEPTFWIILVLALLYESLGVFVLWNVSDF